MQLIILFAVTGVVSNVPALLVVRFLLGLVEAHHFARGRQDSVAAAFAAAGVTKSAAISRSAAVGARPRTAQ